MSEHTIQALDLPDLVQCMTCNAIAHKDFFSDHKCDPYVAATFVEKDILTRLDRIEKILLKVFT